MISDAVRRMIRTLAVLRAIGWPAAAVEVLVLLFTWTFLFNHPGLLGRYLFTLAIVILFFHGLREFAWRRLFKPVQIVGPAGDNWKMGQYTERDLRDQVNAILAGIPVDLRRVRVRIEPPKGTLAWTRAASLLAGRNPTRVVSLTSGVLYYLDREELSAVLLHELGHHVRAHRCGAPGGALLMDTMLHALAFLVSVQSNLAGPGIVFFAFGRSLLGWAIWFLVKPAIQYREHLCDLFAARFGGALAMINALLKIGEDHELTEAILSRAASRLRWYPDISILELAVALEETRPHGRIFHANLFKQADEVYKAVMKKREAKRRAAREESKRPIRNVALQRLVRLRRKVRGARIRWRDYDSNGDGRLSADEIVYLLRELRQKKDHVLFRSWDELNPRTHPSVRDRILLLAEQWESTLRSASSTPAPS